MLRHLFFVGLILWRSSLSFAFAADSAVHIEAIANASSSVEEFTQKLPSAFKENWTALHSSKSSQSEKNATFATPRIIANDGTNNIIALDSKSNEVEWVQFDQKSKKWIFRKIDFASKASKAKITSPTSCKSCHGTPERPIWESYKFWPGAYGASDDFLLKGSAEFENYKKFLKEKGNHPRYRHFVSPDDPLKLTTRTGDETEAMRYDIARLPNSQLTALINQNEISVFTDAALQKLDRKTLLLLIASLMDCEIPALADLSKQYAADSSFLKQTKSYKKSLPKVMKQRNSTVIYRSDTDAEGPDDDSVNEAYAISHAIVVRNGLPFIENSEELQNVFFSPVASPTTLTKPLSEAFIKKYYPAHLSKWQSFFGTFRNDLILPFDFDVFKSQIDEESNAEEEACALLKTFVPLASDPFITEPKKAEPSSH